MFSPVLVLACLLCPVSQTDPPGELATPVRLAAGEKAITAEMGNAAPFFADFDGDGKRDLLLGQFAGGRLRLYRNVGSDRSPRFEDFCWFEADGSVATIPAG